MKNDYTDIELNENKVTVSFLRQTINNSLLPDLSEEKNVVKYRVINKLLDYFEKQGVDTINMGLITENPDLIDTEMLSLGTIDESLGTLYFTIPPVDIIVNLKTAIKKAFMKNKINLIKLLLQHDVNLNVIEPNIMIMALQTNNYELLLNFIDREFDITVQDYRCIYQLAENGKLEIIKKILDKYYFENITEIVCKICVQAIINKHLDIIKYFFTNEAFSGAPDQMYTFFIKGIEFNTSVEIIKFFVENGISLKQYNYKAVKIACMYKRRELLKYFNQLDNTVSSIIIDLLC
ncbi:ankyrin repeat protein [Acanthamoeba polyphaga moumouvirus]|uniref:Ankyrin repeat protein n=2 Tax=Moumouvirus TaxID=3080801 RepID=L7RCU3_9VIRU|nr:ankyrin repeat protein [Acanthamoeba polyphaga moumouvirus]AEX62567.1 putative ankyrin repeat protein [Moumouvirus Monve]AGC02117.1 ankyrin repeat protein [Acanthamoeba polyphaga moumouvirus]AQN68489.1 ankyrin repeat protein [Saudi moumouvirus]